MHNYTTHTVLLAALAAMALAAGAALLKLLTFSGALAAFAVGLFVFGFGGAPFAVPLLVFFVTSSILGRICLAFRPGAAELVAKPGPRDALQVLANGALPTLLVILYATTPDTRRMALLYIAAIAAVNADTWASEVGTLLGGVPRIVGTWKPVEPGTSGAVSFAGLAGALAGATAVVFSAWVAWPARSTILLWRLDAAEAVSLVWAAFIACWADSVLGASLQAKYQCADCGATTEVREHCGVPTTLIRGWVWITNDTVNLVCSAVGIACAWALLRFYAYPV